MWGEHEGMGWWMLFGTVWLVFFWALIVWLFARLLGGPRDEGRRRDESSIEIARRRYASGEITREQFEQMRRDLSG